LGAGFGRGLRLAFAGGFAFGLDFALGFGFARGRAFFFMGGEFPLCRNYRV
jgi:hypothetical protein